MKDLKKNAAQVHRVVISGTNGLVGRALVADQKAKGREAIRLVRQPPSRPDERQWSPSEGTLAADALDNADAVIHLAGEPILGRWTAAKKARIMNSRVNGTRLLAEALARSARPPRIWVSASAIGIYGAQGEAALDESSPQADDFLAQVCRAWEESTRPAVEAGIRVVNLRISMVLSPDGGALASMLLPFKLGLGGRQGDGRQWMSWVALPDLLRIIEFALNTDGLSGPINATTPHPVRNQEFVDTLGRVLRRPTLFPIPGWALRLIFGEVAEATMLASAKVTSSRLEAAGFNFENERLEAALRRVLSR